MKVYVVTDGDFSEEYIAGVFSTAEKADRFIANAGGSGFVEELEVDGREEEALQEKFITVLFTRSGKVSNKTTELDICPPGYSGSWADRKFATGESVVSQEHADKVAAEARQAWLRENGGQK